MTTGTAATTARKYHQDLVHYISCPIVYSTAGAYTVGKLPAGAAVIDAGVVVTTAFAGTAAQTLGIGVSGDATDIASALVLTAAGIIRADDVATASNAYTSTDKDIIATLSAGTDPTDGAGYVYVTYIMANRAA